MNVRVLLGIFLIIILTACSATTVVSDEVVFSGEGEYWKVISMFDPEMYKEKKWKEFAIVDPDGYCIAFGGTNG